MSISNNLLKHMKVLYVEDEEDVLEQMTFFLKKRVGKLVTAKDGKQGLKEFKDSMPDIVISDLKMPVIDGIGMAREIRKISDVPILITTAFSDKEVILKAVDIGIDNYIVKPFDMEDFIEVMKKTAVKVLRSRGELTAVRNKMLSKEEKIEVEENIKKALSKFIKCKTGKGPKTVKAFIHSKILEVEIIEVFTKMEKALLEKEKNRAIIKYSRDTFYSDHEENMKEIIKEFLPWELKLEDIKIDVLEDKNTLKFTLF